MKYSAIRVLLLALALLLLLPSCAKAPVLASENGVYVNKKTGVSYLAASANYEAVAIDKDTVVARMPDKKVGDDLFYRIPGTSTEHYLSNDFYELFYAADLTLPTLEQMAPTTALICKTAVISYSLTQIEEADVLSRLLAVYAGPGFSEDVMITDSGVPESYTLKFQSKEHPSFYYTLSYRRYDREVTVYDLVGSETIDEAAYPGVEVTTEVYKGETYRVYHFGTEILYDRVTGTCYPLGDTLSGYWDYLSPADPEDAITVTT